MSNLSDHHALIALAGISLTGDGSEPPPGFEEIRRSLERGSDEERWKILFALTLDLTRKSAYLFDAAESVSTHLRHERLRDIPNESPLRLLAREIQEHEDRLRKPRENLDWSRLVDELVTIVDEKVKAKTPKRTKLVDKFAAKGPSGRKKGDR